MPEDMMSIPAARREKSDVPGFFIVAAFCGMLMLIGAAGLACWWIFPRAPHGGWLPYPVPTYPAPQLEPSGHQDFVRFYRHELDQLNSAGWVDRQQGIVHIPIEQAMQEVVANGLPDWPTGQIGSSTIGTSMPPEGGESSGGKRSDQQQQGAQPGAEAGSGR